jgi:hypothetical protein
MPESQGKPMDTRRDAGAAPPRDVPATGAPQVEALPPPGAEHVGWSVPKPDVMPRPTYWPVIMAAGITLILFGMVTQLAISAVGLTIVAVALAGWIREILHEGPEHE